MNSTVPISSDQTRVLITRLSHIGDCVLTLPVLCAVRRQFPRAYIAWAVESPSDQLLAGHEALDELIRVPKGWLKSPAKIWQLRKQLRSRKFDVAIDPQSLTKSSALAWLSGARQRIGCGGEHAREAAAWLNHHRVRATKPHLVDRSLELLTKLGIENPAVEFKLPVQPAAIDTANRLIAQENLSSGFVIINPGCGWLSRRWEMDRYALVAQHIGRRHQIPSLVVWAGEAERTMAQTIVADSEGPAILAPATSLQELAALSSAALFYIGSDTGPAHIAAAVGTPCVGLFGTTRPELSGAYGSGHIHLQAYYQEGSSKQRRKAENHAMQAITAAAVCQACDQVLQQRPSSLLKSTSAQQVA